MLVGCHIFVRNSANEGRRSEFRSLKVGNVILVPEHVGCHPGGNPECHTGRGRHTQNMSRNPEFSTTFVP